MNIPDTLPRADLPFAGLVAFVAAARHGSVSRAAEDLALTQSAVSQRILKLEAHVGQRLFLRQTWGLGGGEEAVEADLNQMAGAVDKNRVVLTVGNFSTLDVFDDNAYAKDPRVHFMNAAFMAPLVLSGNSATTSSLPSWIRLAGQRPASCPVVGLAGGTSLRPSAARQEIGRAHV